MQTFDDLSFGLCGLDVEFPQCLPTIGVGCMSVSDNDCLYVKGGVYKHVTGKLLGGHAVKVVGWGVQNTTGEEYWLVANSWGPTWGEEGYFRFSLNDTGECS